MKALGILFLIITFSANAQEGPYKLISSRAHVGQKIIHAIDNSTVGLVQTTLGASHILMYAILNPIQGRSPVPSMRFHNNKKSESAQIVINESIPWFSGAYSLGLFQVGGWAEDHEGGHSVASAALGPLYLPTVGLSYLMESHYSSFMESWADLEADSAPFFLTGDTEVGLGKVKVKDGARDVIVFKFSIDQTQRSKDHGLDSHKVFTWLNTKIISPLTQWNAPDAPPTLVEFDLLNKKIDLIVDNIAVYLSGDQQLRQVISSDQKYLSLRSLPGVERMHLKALKWSVDYGIKYNLNDNFSVTPRVGVSASVDSFSSNESFYNFQDAALEDNWSWAGAAGLSASLELEVMEYATLGVEYNNNWRTNDFFNTSFEMKVSNEKRNPLENFNFLHWVETSAGYKSETWKTPGQTINMSQWYVGIGIRF